MESGINSGRHPGIKHVFEKPGILAYLARAPYARLFRIGLLAWTNER
jgi:hypothetical protein